MQKAGAVPGRHGGRLETLDLLRGLTLISMIIYHGMWDFLYLSDSGASFTALRTWYEGTGGHLWQQSICRTFILLSGFCVPFSRRIFRRGLEVSAGGIAVSAVTVIALYEDRVLFGVLSFLGAAMLVSGILEHFFAGGLKNDPESGLKRQLTGAAVCLFLFHVTRWINHGYLRLGPWIRLNLPAGLYTFGSGAFPGYVLTGLGFPMRDFFSTDYFSFLPWFFLFRAGFFLNRVLAAAGSGAEAGGGTENTQSGNRIYDSPLFHLKLPFLNLIGRHSLPVYLLHQPLLYLLTSFLF